MRICTSCIVACLCPVFVWMSAAEARHLRFQTEELVFFVMEIQVTSCDESPLIRVVGQTAVQPWLKAQQHPNTLHM